MDCGGGRGVAVNGVVVATFLKLGKIGDIGKSGFRALPRLQCIVIRRFCQISRKRPILLFAPYHEEQNGVPVKRVGREKTLGFRYIRKNGRRRDGFLVVNRFGNQKTSGLPTYEKMNGGDTVCCF